MTKPVSLYLCIVLCLCQCATKAPPVAKTAVADTVPLAEVEPLPVTPSYDGHPYAQVYGANQAAVATVNPMATQAGLDALAAGGNAVDAAVAAALTLGVVDSHNSGIGGGCFVLARLASGRVIAIDGREMAPAAASRDMYVVDGVVQKHLSKTGALASGIPGSLRALNELQLTAGKLKLKDVILPAADLAERGFAIDQTLAKRLARTAEKLKQFPVAARIFLDEQGQALQVGQRLVQKDLANSYRNIGEQGIRWFYWDDFATRTEAWMRENGGIITADDFRRYRTVLRQPVISEYQGFTVYGFPPPSSGGVHVAQILNMLAEFDLAAMEEKQQKHFLIETMRLAFADRAYWLGDSDFADVPKGLIDPSYAKTLLKKLRWDQIASVPGHNVPTDASTKLFDKHTTHIATADKEGNWIAITTTLNTSFGSKVVIPGTGVLLNNQMDDFSLQPGVPNAYGLVGAEANSIAAGKRPLSSMSPTIVSKDGSPILTLGAAGGPTIITQVLQALVNHLGMGMPLAEAISAPRVHQQWRPIQTFAEPNLAVDVKDALSAMGHEFKTLGSFGGTQAIGLKEGSFTVVTEPRVIKRNQAQEPAQVPAPERVKPAQSIAQ